MIKVEIPRRDLNKDDQSQIKFSMKGSPKLDRSC